MTIASCVAFASTAAHAETRTVTLEKPGHIVSMQLQSPKAITSAKIRRMEKERDACLRKFGHPDAEAFLKSQPSDAQIQPMYSCMLNSYAKLGIRLTYSTQAETSNKSITRNR